MNLDSIGLFYHFRMMQSHIWRFLGPYKKSINQRLGKINFLTFILVTEKVNHFNEKFHRQINQRNFSEELFIAFDEVSMKVRKQNKKKINVCP